MQSKKFELIRSTYASKDGYLGRKPLPPEIISLTDIIGELMCPGPFYYYVIDSPSLTFEQVSPHVSKVLGYDASEFQLETLVDIIHPEDFPFVNKCEERVADFIVKLKHPEEIFNYKYCYSFRQRRSDGVYRQFLMQTSVLRIQEDGALLKVFGVQTDITDLGGFINRSLFFHGLNGANSFKITNVWKGDLQEKTSFQQSLTKRELEITTLLAEGMSTKEIARHLHVSEETVHSHRKNLLKKTKSKNTVELIANMVRSGWI